MTLSEVVSQALLGTLLETLLEMMYLRLYLWLPFLFLICPYYGPVDVLCLLAHWREINVCKSMFSLNTCKKVPYVCKSSKVP